MHPASPRPAPLPAVTVTLPRPTRPLSQLLLSPCLAPPGPSPNCYCHRRTGFRGRKDTSSANKSQPLQSPWGIQSIAIGYLAE
eukprot:351841-Chlamydomonas_euryale.AAC.15